MLYTFGVAIDNGSEFYAVASPHPYINRLTSYKVTDLEFLC